VDVLTRRDESGMVDHRSNRRQRDWPASKANLVCLAAVFTSALVGPARSTYNSSDDALVRLNK
jgi:hypothetical protein